MSSWRFGKFLRAPRWRYPGSGSSFVAPLLQNTFAGGAQGTPITVGNSGGASGNALDEVLGTVTYDNTFLVPGSGFMAKCAPPAPGNDADFQWAQGFSLGVVPEPFYFRLYLELDSLPAADTIFAATNAGGAGRFWIGGSTFGRSGELHWSDVNGNSAGTGAVAIAPATICRLEGRLQKETNPGVSGDGRMTMRLYLNPASSGPPSDVLDVVGFTGATLAHFYGGCFGNAEDSGIVRRVGKFAVGNGWMGP